MLDLGFRTSSPSPSQTSQNVLNARKHPKTPPARDCRGTQGATGVQVQATSDPLAAAHTDSVPAGLGQTASPKSNREPPSNGPLSSNVSFLSTSFHTQRGIYYLAPWRPWQREISCSEGDCVCRKEILARETRRIQRRGVWSADGVAPGTGKERDERYTVSHTPLDHTSRH